MNNWSGLSRGTTASITDTQMYWSVYSKFSETGCERCRRRGESKKTRPIFTYYIFPESSPLFVCTWFICFQTTRQHQKVLLSMLPANQTNWEGGKVNNLFASFEKKFFGYIASTKLQKRMREKDWISGRRHLHFRSCIFIIQASQGGSCCCCCCCCVFVRLSRSDRPFYNFRASKFVDRQIMRRVNGRIVCWEFSLFSFFDNALSACSLFIHSSTTRVRGARLLRNPSPHSLNQATRKGFELKIPLLPSSLYIFSPHVSS